MAKNPTKIALIYDFDGTLCTTDMQSYTLIPEFGMKPENFWKIANKWSVDNQADQITGSMYYIHKTAKEKGIKLTKDFFKSMGNGIQYFEGVVEWFARINLFALSLDLEIEHYIISAGYEEIIEGALIRQEFKDIFACSYAYDDNQEAVWPARVVNYTAKVQYLSKINKGLGKLDDKAVNEFSHDSDRPIPFRRMIYFGDGMTDIPSMKLTKERGGSAIAVYKPKSKNRDNAIKLLKDGRVNFALPADYNENKDIEKVVKTILRKIATERDLEVLKNKEAKKIKLDLSLN